MARENMYIIAAEKYRPKTIKELLIGEAPPPGGNHYFYIPRSMSTNTDIRNDTSLPATIFHHYFNFRPSTVNDYIILLERLQNMGVFLIDICDDPIRVRGCQEGVDRIINEIPNLRTKMDKRGIVVKDEDITFLLARKSYLKHLRSEFRTSRHVSWIDFRMGTDRINGIRI